MKFTVAFLLLSTACAPAASTQPAPPADINTKSVTITLPFSDWRAIIESLDDSQVISARDAKKLIQTIGAQGQSQIAPPASPPKK
jgi:hypothetical protein